MTRCGFWFCSSDDSSNDPGEVDIFRPALMNLKHLISSDDLADLLCRHHSERDKAVVRAAMGTSFYRFKKDAFFYG